jgi:hypothetical protein
MDQERPQVDVFAQLSDWFEMQRSYRSGLAFAGVLGRNGRRKGQNEERAQTPRLAPGAQAKTGAAQAKIGNPKHRRVMPDPYSTVLFAITSRYHSALSLGMRFNVLKST